MIRANIGEVMDKLEINIFNNLIKNQEDIHLVDGLPYCNICKEPRFYKRDEWILPAKCKCQTDKERLQKEKERIEQAERNFREQQKLSAIGEKYLNASFENAIITNNNKEVYAKCKKYCELSNEMQLNNIGIYIYGDNSSGKTHLIACMCNSLVKQGKTCLFTSIPKILAKIQQSYSNKNGMSQEQIIEEISSTQFLFLDDLGKEFLVANPKAEGVLLAILNARDTNGLPTIITSNYNIEQFAVKFGLDKAIIERLNVISTRIFQLNGDDFRSKELDCKQNIAKKLGI